MRYTSKQLKEMPTLEQGHYDNLKIKTETTKVWLSRMTVGDGQPYDNEITVEELINGIWTVTRQYEG